MISYKNRKPSLKLYKTLSANLKDGTIENLSICVIYPFKKEFKIFEQVVLLHIFLRFFISNHVTFMMFFSVYLSY